MDYILINETTKLLTRSRYQNDRPTVIFADGFNATYQSAQSQIIVEAYIIRSDHNILVLDWTQYSGGDYFWNAVPNSYKVGEVVAKALLDARKAGLNLEKFHFVGHSLGAQLAGMIGRSIISQSNGNFKLSRITALDPAGNFSQLKVRTFIFIYDS